MIDIDNLRLMIEKAAEETNNLTNHMLGEGEYDHAIEIYGKLIDYYKYVIDKVFIPCTNTKSSMASVLNVEP